MNRSTQEKFAFEKGQLLREDVLVGLSIRPTDGDSLAVFLTLADTEEGEYCDIEFEDCLDPQVFSGEKIDFDLLWESFQNGKTGENSKAADMMQEIISPLAKRLANLSIARIGNEVTVSLRIRTFNTEKTVLLSTLKPFLA